MWHAARPLRPHANGKELIRVRVLWGIRSCVKPGEHARQACQARSLLSLPRATIEHEWKAVLVATIDNLLKQKLEHLLGMRGGYVLDFSNASFAEFVRSSIGIDPYSLHEGSKAQVLRSLWFSLSDPEFARLTIDMLEYRRLAEKLGRNAPADAERSAADLQLAEEIVGQLGPLIGPDDRLTRDEAAFLAKDMERVDLSRVDVPIDFQSVIADRLQEVDACFESGAPLAVVILCGSTLEGLLYEVATRNPVEYNQTRAAPRSDGKVRPLPEWSLNNLLNTSRELGVLGEDVIKFAHAVREFRNYVHPRQQVKESFRPRQVTAQIARHVLRAAIEDLGMRRPKV